MGDGYERHDYHTYRVHRKEHTPDKGVPFRATEAWDAAKQFAEAFDLPNKSLVIVRYTTTYGEPTEVERTFEISVGKLYGASEH